MNIKKCALLILIITTGCNTIQNQNSNTLYDYDIEDRLKELGIELQETKLPPGLSIELAKRKGDMIYLSGNGPKFNNGEQIQGKVGKDLTITQGYEAARLTAINHLSILKSEIGDLNKVV
ncbi:MAG: RidA family protein, partial [Bacteroidota bacterium]